MNITDEMIEKLATAEYGSPAIYEVDDETSIRCKVEPDDLQVQDLWCDDAYGPISQNAYDYWRDGKTPRPSNMDGRAVKIEVDRGLWMWWQAPDDFKMHTDEWRKLRDHVTDLLQFGFVSVGVEICHGEDAYGRPIVVECAWTGGVDSTDQDYLSSIIHDLLLELDHVCLPTPMR